MTSLHKEISFEDEICDTSPRTAGSTRRRRRPLRPRPRSVPARLRRLGQATQPKAWETLTKNHGAGRRRHAARPHPQTARRPGHARRAAPRRRDDRPAAAARAGAVQAGAGDERRHSGALCRQPAARRPAGALFAGKRELHRPRAVPQWPAGRDGRTEDRLHAERRGRHRPVSFRPPARSPRAKPPSRCWPSPAGRWSISR